MAENVAIVAHFDPLDRLAPAVIEMLSCLENTLDRVVLVSTSPVDTDALPQVGKVELIVRPNIGYDFYSYRVGLDRVWNDANKVLLINTSIVILDANAFTCRIARNARLRRPMPSVSRSPASSRSTFSPTCCFSAAK